MGDNERRSTTDRLHGTPARWPPASWLLFAVVAVAHCVDGRVVLGVVDLEELCFAYVGVRGDYSHAFLTFDWESS